MFAASERRWPVSNRNLTNLPNVAATGWSPSNEDSQIAVISASVRTRARLVGAAIFKTEAATLCSQRSSAANHFQVVKALVTNRDALCGAPA